MKPLKIVFGLLSAAILVLVGVAFLLPTTYSVERSVVIDASPARVHEFVGDLEKWPAWTPWNDEDPTMKATVTQATGVGAHQSWTGDGGTGALTFTESSSISGIAYDLQFDAKYKCTSSMRYTPEGEKTRVAWAMQGDDGGDLFGRYFVAMADGMIGGMFDKGLAKLKKVAESK